MQTQRGTDRASENAKDIVQHAGSLTWLISHTIQVMKRKESNVSTYLGAER
jgi:hypothetical protein